MAPSHMPSAEFQGAFYDQMKALTQQHGVSAEMEAELLDWAKEQYAGDSFVPGLAFVKDQRSFLMGIDYEQVFCDEDDEDESDDEGGAGEKRGENAQLRERVAVLEAVAPLKEALAATQAEKARLEGEVRAAREAATACLARESAAAEKLATQVARGADAAVAAAATEAKTAALLAEALTALGAARAEATARAATKPAAATPAAGAVARGVGGTGGKNARASSLKAAAAMPAAVGAWSEEAVAAARLSCRAFPGICFKATSGKFTANLFIPGTATSKGRQEWCGQAHETVQEAVVGYNEAAEKYGLPPNREKKHTK